MKRSLKWLKKLATVAAMAALVVLLLLYLDGVFSPKVRPAAGGNTARPVGNARVVEAKLVTVPSFEQAPGTIRPLHETSLASKIREPEKVLEVNVVAGQQVRKGQLLVKLDPATWQNRKEMAEAKLASAKAARDDAQKNFDRMKEALSRNVATQAELDTAKYRLDASASEVVTAQRAVDESQMNLQYTQIVAPGDAVVIDKRVDAGDTVTAGQVLVSLYDKMQLVASVRESLMGRLKVDQAVGVQIEGLGGCEGTVSEIVPQADPATRTFTVKVTGPCHSGVRPGMYAKLNVPLGDRQVLVIPPAAVQQVGQLTTVDVVAAGALQRRSIQLGSSLVAEGETLVEVLSGLKPGEKIAVAPGEAAHGKQ